MRCVDQSLPPRPKRRSSLIGKASVGAFASIGLVVALSTAASATWSITAVDEETGQVGAALATCLTEAQIGGLDEPLDLFAVAPGQGIGVSQAYLNRNAVAPMRQALSNGSTPAQVVSQVANSRFDSSYQWRQYGASSFAGPSATFTGTNALAFRGSRTGSNVSVQGNVLTNEKVINSTFDTYNRTEGSMEYRLAQAMLAGSDEGGDSRCDGQTAGIVQVVVYNPNDATSAPSFIDAESASIGSTKNPVAVLADRVTNAADEQRPSPPRGLKIQSSSPTSVRLAWAASTDNVAVTGYTVRDSLTGQAWRSTGPSITISGLDPALTYRLSAKAHDAAGNSSWRSNEITVSSAADDTERPSPPRGLKVTSSSATSFTIRWTASTDNVGVARYLITDRVSGQTWSSSTTSLVANNRAAGAELQLFVRATDAAGNTSWRSNVTTVVADGVDAERPSAPKGLRITRSSATSASLSWSPSTDNVGVTGYQVVDALSGQTWSATSATVTLSGLRQNQAYEFYVKAADAAGNTSWRSNISKLSAR